MSQDPDVRRSELERAMVAFGEAWARGDAAVLEDLLSPTYTHGDYLGGSQGRADWLAYAAGRTRLHTTLAFREVEIRFVGMVAVVTGINDITYRASGSASVETQSVRFTQVWVENGGRWLREAFQATRMPAQA
ncbi:nuclear transport factor 2 family protein [Prosthecomicrobium sp. N25]|uniref:nuclear transport factor 2 family protein n=1 Tax=Prosthecomicrobium sp. N25 TaxID=3129254 RepID=UPI0030781CBF